MRDSDARWRHLCVWITIIAVWLFRLGAATDAFAQTPGQVVTVTSACADCVARPTLEYTIKGTNTPLEGLPRGVTQDRRGRLIVWRSRSAPLVFDASGRFLNHLGKVGVGPGEVTPVGWVVAGDDDTLRVYSNTRVDIFTGDLRYVRTFVRRSPDTAPLNIVQLPGGMTASLSGHVPGAGDLSPVYLRDRTERLIRQLSPTRRPLRPSRALAAAGARQDALLWVAESYFVRTNGYEVMLVDTLGRVQQNFRRQAEWWNSRASAPAPGVYSTSDTARRPPSSIVGVREDGRGRLLVLVSHSREDWKAVRVEDRYQERNYLAVLDVIDPRYGRLLGTLRVEGQPLAVVSDDRFVTYREDRDGYPYIDIWRIKVP